MVGGNLIMIYGILGANVLLATHPWHVHGRDMQILSEGEGVWDGSITRQDNPVRRDVHLIRAYGHLAMQFPGDNAGVWPFHWYVPTVLVLYPEANNYTVTLHGT